MSWWNPVSWWDDASKTATGVVTAVENWTKHIVKAAIDLVEADIFDTINFASGLFFQLFGLIKKAEGDAYGWVIGAVHTAEALVSRSARDILSWATAAIRDVSNAVTYTVHLAEHLYNDVVAWASKEIARLGHDISSAVDYLITLAQRLISKAISDLYHLILRDFIAPIVAVINVVKKAWDWMIYFAEHPFAFFHDAETDAIDLVKHLPDNVFTAVKGREFSDQVEEVAKWFGH